jgi:hypothetical protein
MVTTRFSPAASAAGCFVGQVPVAVEGSAEADPADGLPVAPG